MTTKILPGGITRGVRQIEKAEAIRVQVGYNRQPTLNVEEYGDTRCLPISRVVAEVLIAWGISYGD